MSTSYIDLTPGLYLGPSVYVGRSFCKIMSINFCGQLRKVNIHLLGITAAEKYLMLVGEREPNHFYITINFCADENLLVLTDSFVLTM